MASALGLLMLGLLMLAVGCTSSATAIAPTPSSPGVVAGTPSVEPAGAASVDPAGPATAGSAPAGSSTAGDDADASAVVSQFGAVPIPSVHGGGDPTPTASSGRPQLLAMGAPVNVRLAGVIAVATALGPVQLQQPAGTPASVGATASAGGRASVSAPAPAGPRRSTAAEITLTVTTTTGSLRFGAADLTSRDQTGASVRLAARGPAEVTASPGRPATLAVQGTYDNGSAQLTWRHGGAVVAVWVFTIELD